jgi:hypothetical protein
MLLVNFYFLGFRKLDHLLIFLISGLGMLRSPVSELCARVIPVSGLCGLLVFISELCWQHSCWRCSVFVFVIKTGSEYKNKMYSNYHDYSLSTDQRRYF